MENIYIEETNAKSIFKTLIIICFLLGLLIGGYIYFHNKNILRLNSVTIELGNQIPTKIDLYVKNKVKNANDYKLHVSSVSVDQNGVADEVGEFLYTVTYENQKKKGKIIVKDTTAPKVVLKDLNVGVNEDFRMEEAIESCEDLSLPCKVEFKSSRDKIYLTQIGTHTVTLKISDKYGNYVYMDTQLTTSSSDTLLGEKQSDLSVVRTDPEYYIKI